MAKATLLFIGTADGVVLWSDPGGTGRWLRAGRSLPGQAIRALWAKPDDPQIVLALAGASLQRSSDGGRELGRHQCHDVLGGRTDCCGGGGLPHGHRLCGQRGRANRDQQRPGPHMAHDHS